jgi:AraC-like DNA-binding protein
MTYLKEWRLARTADLLLDPDLTLDAIARRVGYSDGTTPSSVFKAARGIRPGSTARPAAPADRPALRSSRDAGPGARPRRAAARTDEFGVRAGSSLRSAALTATPTAMGMP